MLTRPARLSSPIHSGQAGPVSLGTYILVEACKARATTPVVRVPFGQHVAILIFRNIRQQMVTELLSAFSRLCLFLYPLGASHAVVLGI
jgi:hypothetical protein